MVVVAAACSAEPGADSPAEPLSAAESEVLTKAVEGTVETLSEVSTTDLAVSAAIYRRIWCATVETDRRTFLTVTFACTVPFNIAGTIHFEKSTPDQLVSITDLMINKVSIDSANTLVVPADPTKPRTFDGALVVQGPTRELSTVISASWVVSGRCVILDAAVFMTNNMTETALTITGKRICGRF